MIIIIIIYFKHYNNNLYIHTHKLQQLLAILLSLISINVYSAELLVPSQYLTIQSAIDVANNGDTVLVAAGTYIENISISKSISVISLDGPDVTIIDGNMNDTVVDIVGNPVLSGFTIVNGECNSTSCGSAISSLGSPTIEDNIIQGHNSDAYVVQMSFFSGEVKDNLFRNNDSGALRLIGSSGEVRGNTFINNGQNGFAFSPITLASSDDLIIQNSINNNIIANRGGGITITGSGSPLIIQNVITNNRVDVNSSEGAGIGGAIYFSGSSSEPGPYILNNTIVNNIAANGTGIYTDGFGGQGSIINNVIFGSDSSTAIYCEDFGATPPPSFVNNNIYNPSGITYGGFCTDQTSSNGNISNDPLFIDIATENYLLTQGSSNIDSGNNTANNIPQTDFAGFSRIQDGNNDNINIIDIGAYEFSFAGSLIFEFENYSVSEDASSVTVNICRVGGSNGNVSSTYNTSNITAVDGIDYVQSNGVISFDNGELGCKPISVNIIDDFTLTNDTTFNIALNSPTGGATLGDISNTIVTIFDSEVNLSLSKDVDKPQISIGETITYTISISNIENTTAQDVIITDTLPNGIGLISTSSSQGSCAGATTIVCNLGNLSPNSTASITINAVGNISGSKNNSATVSVNGTDIELLNNTDSAFTLVTTDIFGLLVPSEFQTIQEAINAASNGDRVLVSPGIYYENIDYQGKELTIESTHGAEATIIDGGQNDAVVTFNGNNIPEFNGILRGFTIQNGRSNAAGGIDIFSNSPLIENNIIKNNQRTVTTSGSAIVADGGNTIIRNNIIEDNTSYGAPIAIEGSLGVTTVESNIIRNNISTGSGVASAIHISFARNSVLRNNKIINNQTNACGAIYIERLSFGTVVDQNIIANNSGAETGGFCIDSTLSFATVSNNTFYNNVLIDETEQNAGANVHYITSRTDSIANFYNNIFYADTAQSNFYCSQSSGSFGPPIIENNLFYNLAGNEFGGLCIDQSGQNGNITGNPLFQDINSANYRLKVTSPAIDASNNDNISNNDLDGVPRMIDGDLNASLISDIGAYEFNPYGLFLSPEQKLNFKEDASNATLSICRLEGLSNEVSVSYFTVDITAVAGINYEESTGTIIFAENESGCKPIDINLIDQNSQKTSSFKLYFDNPTGGALIGLPNPILITIDGTPKSIELFPLTPGVIYTYTDDSTLENSNTILNQSNFNGVNAFGIQDSEGDIEYYTNDENGLLNHGFIDTTDNSNIIATPPLKILDSNPFIGQRIETSGILTFNDPQTGTFNLDYTYSSIVKGYETITVPIGTFNALKVEINLNASFQIVQTTTYWLVEAIGIIKEVSITDGVTSIRELNAVDGITIDSPPTEAVPTPIWFYPLLALLLLLIARKFYRVQDFTN